MTTEATVRRLPPAPVYAVLLLLSLAVALLSLTSGAYPLPVRQVLALLANSNTGDTAAQMVLFDIRMPRLLLGFLTGAVLAVSGAILQIGRAHV